MPKGVAPCLTIFSLLSNCREGVSKRNRNLEPGGNQNDSKGADRRCSKGPGVLRGSGDRGAAGADPGQAEQLTEKKQFI